MNDQTMLVVAKSDTHRPLIVGQKIYADLIGIGYNVLGRVICIESNRVSFVIPALNDENMIVEMRVEHVRTELEQATQIDASPLDADPQNDPKHDSKTARTATLAWIYDAPVTATAGSVDDDPFAENNSILVEELKCPVQLALEHLASSTPVLAPDINAELLVMCQQLVDAIQSVEQATNTQHSYFDCAVDARALIAKVTGNEVKGRANKLEN